MLDCVCRKTYVEAGVIMTIEIIRLLIKLTVAAVIVAFAMLLFVLGSRYTLPVASLGAIVFAVYATARIAKKGLLQLR